MLDLYLKLNSGIVILRLHGVSRIRWDFFFNCALQYHLLASCGVKIFEVSAVAVYNLKAQTSLHHVF
jgi:hypothetical protein